MKSKASSKHHTLDDVITSIPAFIHISNAKMHDVNPLSNLKFSRMYGRIIDKSKGIKHDKIGKLTSY